MKHKEQNPNHKQLTLKEIADLEERLAKAFEESAKSHSQKLSENK